MAVLGGFVVATRHGLHHLMQFFTNDVSHGRNGAISTQAQQRVR